MTIDEIAEKAFGGEDIRLEAEEFCRQKQITPSVFLDTFARHISVGYMERRFMWEPCDTAMNLTYVMMLECPKIPDFAWGVFLAFDDAEYEPSTHHRAKDWIEDDVTRPQIGTLLEKYPTVLK